VSHHFLPDGTALWYEMRGEGRPLVLLQGLQFPSGFFWSRNVERLSKSSRVLMIDLRGQGLSGKTKGGCTIAQNAADLEHLLNALDIEGAVLLGVAFGGLVALQYLKDFGGRRLRGLGLCEMTPRLVSAPGWEHPTFGDFPQAFAEGYGDSVRADRAVLDGFLAAAFATSPEGDELNEMKGQLQLTPTDTVADLIDDMVRMDFREMLPMITLPTLLVYGRGQNPVMPGRVGAWMADRIPEAQLVELPGGGHSVFWEDAPAFDAAVAAFAVRV
jgi:pimeloyl-ACP methyl ester carboxylesterase